MDRQTYTNKQQKRWIDKLTDKQRHINTNREYRETNIHSQTRIETNTHTHTRIKTDRKTSRYKR